eukprot:CAMPEP_0113879828 /NCGR_PEP_ID=MMETSP0780_2-20120614/7448_1 /TAXON_ID=652834 /ORGANISM="Palpitomonas bilix" /LENGTH=202 /DNA_ID=CAMNT_0000866439 /DNA_START=195 /DNA_END=803 /DNA_ORIENTATION=- /assembly_acc=CAM_ASM_000599
MKKRGNKYSSKNIEREIDRKSRGEPGDTRPLPCDESRAKPVQKKKVAVPLVYGQGGGHSEDPLERVPKYGRVDFIQKKKGANAIEAEGGGLFAEREKYRPTFKPGQLKGGEDEKDRLAKLNEFNGKLPKIAAVAPPSPPPAPLSKEEQRQQLMSAIVEEIQEREEFLDAMRGKKNEYEGAVKAEIAERLRELQKLEAMSFDD